MSVINIILKTLVAIDIALIVVYLMAIISKLAFLIAKSNYGVPVKISIKQETNTIAFLVAFICLYFLIFNT